MARMAVWVWATLGLVAMSVGVSTLVLSAIEMNFTTIFVMSSVLLLPMGITFLFALWISSRLNGTQSYREQPLSLHDAKMLRQENNWLKSELSKRDRRIEDLEIMLRQMQEDDIRRTLPPPPVRATGETESGTYRQPFDPQETQPARRFAPARRTGTSAAVRDVNEFPTMPSLPGSLPPLELEDEEQTALYSAVKGGGNHRHVARRGNTRNGHYHR